MSDTRPQPLSVPQSARFIAEHATAVRVDEAKCAQVADKIYTRMLAKNYSTGTWNEHPLNPKEKSQSTVDWVFTVDTLNFSFWSDKPQSERYTVEYKGERYTGYWSLVAAINRALDEGIPITTPSFWRSPDFTPDLLKRIFRSETAEEIPLAQERYNVLIEAGAQLAKLGFESAADLVESANGSALQLLNTLSTAFASYRDVATYRGQEVQILKRAQIFIGEIWACFDGRSYGHFDDIDKLTMFADYRVPQILHDLGCLTYSKDLETKIRAGEMIAHNSEPEIELRGCSIWAVEVMAEILRGHARSLNSVLIDFYLWDTAKEQEVTAGIPAHRTRSVFY